MADLLLAVSNLGGGGEAEKRQMGGQNVSCDVGWRGGKRTLESALQNQFWRAQKVGLVWSVHVPSKENGVQKRFWEGLYGMFSPPLCFATPPLLFFEEASRR